VGGQRSVVRGQKSEVKKSEVRGQSRKSEGQLLLVGATEYGLRSTDYGVRTTDHGPRATDYGLRTTTTDYCSQLLLVFEGEFD